MNMTAQETTPSDAAIGQAFRESKKRVFNSHEECEYFIDTRAREIEQGRGAHPRWVNQTVFGEGGNCTQAAVASILGLPLSAVPDFIEGPPTIEQFWDRFESFLLSVGFQVELRPGHPMMDGLYLASGRSSRDRAHMVVMNGGSLVHDPHPSNEGVKDVEYIHVLIPIDPALCLPPHGESR